MRVAALGLCILLVAWAPTLQAQPEEPQGTRVQPQQSVAVPGDHGHAFGEDITVANGGALVVTRGDGLVEINGPSHLLPLVKSGTRWSVAPTLGIPSCSSTLYDYVITSEFTPWAARDMRYIGNPCDEPFPPLPNVSPGGVQPFTIGSVDEFPVNALTPVTTYRAPFEDEWMRFGRDVAAGPGWFAVVAQASDVPFEQWNSEPTEVWNRVYAFRQGDAEPFWSLDGQREGFFDASQVEALGDDLFVLRESGWDVYTSNGDSLVFLQALDVGAVRGQGTTFMDGMDLWERGPAGWSRTHTFEPPAHNGYGHAQGSYARPGLAAIGARTQWHNEVDPTSGEVTATIVDDPGVVYVYREDPDGWIIHEEIRIRETPTSYGQTVGIDKWDVLIGDPTDGHGRVHIRAVNQWPTAAFSWSPTPPLSLTQVQFTDLSIDPEGAKIKHQWDFDGDGDVDSTTKNPTWTFDRSGDHVVSLRVEDPVGGFSEIAQTVHVANRAPLIDYTFTPTILWRQQTHTADDLSIDLDGDIVAWLWEFGDGRTSTEQQPSVVYPVKGLFEVSFTIWDNYGDSVTISKWHQVFNHPPVITFDSPQSVLTLESVPMTVSVHDPDGSIVSHGWIDDIADGLETEFFFDRPGRYLVAYTATDDDGDATTELHTYEVINRPPTASFVLPDGRHTRTQYTFQDTSNDLDGIIEQWQWNFGDGDQATEPSPVHTYDEVGTYDVQLRVRDHSGAWSEWTTQRLDIDNPAPYAAVSVVYENGQFTVQDASKDDGQIIKRTWRVGQDALESTEDAIVISATSLVRVELTVEDDDGAVGTAVAWLSPPTADTPPEDLEPVSGELVVIGPGRSLPPLSYQPPILPADDEPTTSTPAPVAEATGSWYWWLLLFLPVGAAVIFLVWRRKHA